MEPQRKSIPVILREKWDTKEQYLEYLRHLAAYVILAESFIANKKVLEIGCGSGYGAEYLSESASHIAAIDISKGGVSQCWDKYSKGNLHFVLGDGTNLPFKHSSFDVVMSFQVIEHIEPKFVLDYLAEIRRVLRTGGTFICSTPNKKLRLLPLQKPWNPEHKKEYDCEELNNLLIKVFEQVKVYGLRGSDEIQATERNRVKQTPFKAYIMIPILNLLPSPIATWVIRMRQRFLKRHASYELMPQETFTGMFSLSDFKVDRSCLEGCLDLYGICTKSRKNKIDKKHLGSISTKIQAYSCYFSPEPSNSGDSEIQEKIA